MNFLVALIQMINLIIILGLAGLIIYALILAIKVLKIYIKNNS